MVTVTGYKSRKNKSGEEFIALDIIGSLELVQSNNTGRFYATVRRCSIPSTFDETIAEMMVGSKIDGEIVRVPCESYEYTVKRTGECITLGYTYSFMPPGSKELIGHGTVEIEEPAPQKPKDAITKAAERNRKKLTATK